MWMLPLYLHINQKSDYIYIYIAGAVECISLKRALFVLFLLVLHCHEKCVFCSFIIIIAYAALS